jgi:uncharacterized protein (DUF362 family)
MDRRAFFKKSIGASVLAGSFMKFTEWEQLLAQGQNVPAGLPFDLVAVKGGEPDVMFDKAIEAFGGMKKFVTKGNKVVVKPNMGWDVSPERGGNTHPKLVARIIKQCYEAGAKEVYVFDHTCDAWQKAYKNSGIEAAVKDAGGKIAPGHSESYYHDVAMPKGKAITKAKEHELILESDVFINVPILKHHSSTRLSIAMKNLMGIVWDRREWHGTDLHQSIADYATYRKPTLNVVDAYYVMQRNGPRGVSLDDVVTMKAQLLSTDIVAVDAASAKLFGKNPDDIPYIQFASEMNVGRKDIEKLNIKRISV